jgi:hypothetical protein
MTRPKDEPIVIPTYPLSQADCPHAVDGLDWDDEGRLFCTECGVRFKPLYTQKRTVT